MLCLTVRTNYAGEPFSKSLISGIEKFSAQEGYVTIFSPKFSVSQYRKISQGNPLYFTKVPVPKKLLDERGEGEGGIITIFSRKILSHSTESFPGGTLMRFLKVWSIEKFMPRRGISRFSRESLYSHSTENLRRGTLLGFTKLRRSKSFMDEGETWRDEVSRFSVKEILSHSAEKFHRTQQCFINFGYPKRKEIREGELESRFSMEFIFLTVATNFAGVPFSVSLISGIEKVSAQVGYVTIFCPKLSVSQYRKTSHGNPSCYTKVLVPKNILDEKGRGEGGIIRVFSRKIFSHSTESSLRRTLLRLLKVRVIKNVMPTRGISRFSREKCSLTARKIFVGEPFYVPQNF